MRKVLLFSAVIGDSAGKAWWFSILTQRLHGGIEEGEEEEQEQVAVEVCL